MTHMVYYSKQSSNYDQFDWSMSDPISDNDSSTLVGMQCNVNYLFYEKIYLFIITGKCD